MVEPIEPGLGSPLRSLATPVAVASRGRGPLSTVCASYAAGLSCLGEGTSKMTTRWSYEKRKALVDLLSYSKGGEPVTRLALCEQREVALKADRLYEFYIDPGCERCLEWEQASRMA